mmetsp:Transcript_10093/g.22929  ORF Transcript_10093/g.22929 Transcript_10093/m.22929 type:complete len:331 (-) Transcript_10093:9-1001(-)
MDTALAIVFALLGALCCSLGLYSLAATLFRYMGARKFLRDDVEVTSAKILRKSSRGRFQVSPSVRFLPQLMSKHACRYSFDVARADGGTSRVEATSEVPCKQWMELEEGQTTQVLYKKTEVRLSELDVAVRQEGTCWGGAYRAELCLTLSFALIGFIVGLVLPFASGNYFAVLACILPACWFGSSLRRGGCTCCCGICVHRTDPEENLWLCCCCARRSSSKRTTWMKDWALWRSEMDFEYSDFQLLQAKVHEVKAVAAVSQEVMLDPLEQSAQTGVVSAEPAPSLAAIVSDAGAGDTGGGPRPKAKAKSKAKSSARKNESEADVIGRSDT